MTSRLGVMKAEMIGADFENDTLTFKVSGDYYARTGWFYIVPNIVYEELVERGSAKKDADADYEQSLYDAAARSK